MAATIAVNSVQRWLDEHGGDTSVEKVVFVVSHDVDAAIYHKLLG